MLQKAFQEEEGKKGENEKKDEGTDDQSNFRSFERNQLDLDLQS